MGHRVIYGGGAALAQPLVAKWLEDGHEVTAICRNTLPPDPWPDRLAVCDGAGQMCKSADVLVTLTGAVDNAPLIGMANQQWDRVIADTLTAPFQALRRLLPYVREGGNVVVVGSIVGSTGGRGCANYAAAKAGLMGLVRAAANEVAGSGVCVNLLELGYTDAGMGTRLPEKVRNATIDLIPLKRFGTEGDFVHAVEFLATTRYMSGDVLTLAGGLR